MAQIDLENIDRIEKERVSIHEKARSTYFVFEENGTKFLQIDMYGKSTRDNPEKISQSIQIDESAARYLVNLLLHEFDL